MSKNDKPECKNGSACVHLKAGKCKFAHPTGVVKTRKNRVGSVKEVHSKIASHHAKAVIKIKDQIARTKAVSAILIGKDSKQSWADQDELEAMMQQLVMMRASARSAIGGQHIRVKLYVSNTISSGAGAAIAGYYGVGPSGSSEWASLISLYDECRVDSIVIRHLCGVTTAAAAGVNGGQSPYAISWDPDYGTTPSGVVDVQESKYSSLHAMAGQVGFGGMPVTPVDYHVFKAKIPHTGAVLNSDMKTNPNFPGSWFSCLDASDTTGFIRYYATALGGTGTLGWYQNMEMTCEFRIRT